jgi:hypothetical protein
VCCPLALQAHCKGHYQQHFFLFFLSTIYLFSPWPSYKARIREKGVTVFQGRRGTKSWSWSCQTVDNKTYKYQTKVKRRDQTHAENIYKLIQVETATKPRKQATAKPRVANPQAKKLYTKTKAIIAKPKE